MLDPKIWFNDPEQHEWPHIRGVASMSYKGVRSSEDPCSADTNSPIGHHIAIMRAIQYMIIHIIL